MNRRARVALGFLLLLFAWSAWAQVAVPELSRRVTDLTATLSADQVAALENKLAAFEAKKGSQIAVLLVPTTEPEDIAQFGIRVADQWKIGREKVDDGVILIVAKNDRKLRIEVGYGLEGAIPDAIAKRVIAEVITPYFKAGDFHGGIDAGVQQLMRLVAGEALPAPGTAGADLDSDAFIILIVGGVFGGLLLTTLMGQTAAASVAALGSAIVGAMWFGISLVLLIIALFVFGGVALILGGGGGWSNGGGYGGGPWRGGSGGLGGGGSWGGGGGGFGGGGASGSW
ncbi:MAG: TPM domain-containing protein [Thiobacillus sp.]|nr:TPM domain-containing protein [Thiobacillus sp.]